MTEQFVSTGTVITLLLGVVIGYFYLKQMWIALQNAVRTREDPDVGNDRYRHSLVGAVIAVLSAIVAIAVYGAGPALLYLGPGLALLAAVAVTYCLREEALHG